MTERLTRIEPVESWGKYVLDVWLDGKWVAFHTDYAAVVEGMRAKITKLIAAARELAAIREGSGLTPERRAYINKVRNCVVFIEPDAGVKETQAAFDELLSVIDSLTAEVARLKEELAGKERECGELRNKSMGDTAFRNPYTCEVCGKAIKYFVELAQIEGQSVADAHSFHGDCWKRIGSPTSHEAVIKALGIASAAEGGSNG